MVADVQAWVSNSASNFGWVILADEITTHSAQRLDSREHTTHPPQLTVTYQVPCSDPDTNANPDDQHIWPYRLLLESEP